MCSVCGVFRRILPDFHSTYRKKFYCDKNFPAWETPGENHALLAFLIGVLQKRGA